MNGEQERERKSEKKFQRQKTKESNKLYISDTDWTFFSTK